MLKFAIVLFFAILAASSDESVANFITLSGKQTECDDSCVRTLKPMLDLLTAQQNRLNDCEKRSTNAAQVRIEGQLEDLRKNVDKFSPTYEKIGLRFFYIEKRQKQNWFSAANFCRQKGGYLASIRSVEELTLISTRLNAGVEFWIDINDLSNQEEYISSSSGKVAPFLDWQDGEPSTMENTQRCVSVINGKMKVNLCASKNNFICQSDD
ncbi:C-type lectin 37Db-like [Drosophila gunungcola]|uniref:C-type lectin 37Db-like n=1 Tax=Drosophila gunungcola TaxID=103775 RepID=UPI0022E22D11|nr:C-type lectin 37Db-like [Drosophila gunungcola]